MIRKTPTRHSSGMTRRLPATVPGSIEPLSPRAAPSWQLPRQKRDKITRRIL